MCLEFIYANHFIKFCGLVPKFSVSKGDFTPYSILYWVGFSLFLLYIIINLASATVLRTLLDPCLVWPSDECNLVMTPLTLKLFVQSFQNFCCILAWRQYLFGYVLYSSFVGHGETRKRDSMSTSVIPDEQKSHPIYVALYGRQHFCVADSDSAS